MSYDRLENNLNDSHVNKAWFWHQEVAKLRQMQGNCSLRGQSYILCYSIRNMRFRWAILHQSWVQIDFNGLKNNLKDSNVNKAWFWQQEVAKIHQMQENQSLKGSTLHCMLFL